MTSPTSKTRRSEAAAGVARAFTLLELVLALSVLVVLVAIAAVGLAGGPRSEYVEEGASRLATAMRMARADALNRGRVIQLRFGEDGTCTVFHEPRPLDKPGQYTPYITSGWATDLPNDVVRVESSRMGDGERYIAPDGPTAMSNDRSDGPPLDAITFRPDGSCDSATVTLRSVEPRDQRRAIVTVDGANAQFNVLLLTPIELKERQDLENSRGY